MVFWLAPLLISLAINIVAYLLMPKPKAAKPAAAQQLDSPTAEAGREIPVVFGTITVTSPNILWYGEKALRTYEVDA